MDNKKIKDAIDKLNKNFGSGTVMSFDKDEIVPLERISTGSLQLDMITGGGWPKGRIIEIYGPESSGKCLNASSYIYTANGYKTVKEIFEENSLELFCITKEIPIKYSLINWMGEEENTTHFTYNGKKSLTRITTKSGFTQERTFKHPLLIISKNGNLVWRWTGEIQKGDYLVNRKFQHFGNRNCSENTAYAIGLLLADGGLTDGLPLITNNDPSVLEFIQEKIVTALDVEGYHINVIKKNKGSELETYTFKLKSKRGAKEFYRQWDLSPVLSKYKTIPKWVRELDRNSMASFLRGFLDSESYMKDHLEVSSASYILLYQIKLILSQFGIVSMLDKIGPIKGYEENDYWRLSIYGDDYEDYIYIIGTNSEKQKLAQKEFLEYRKGLSQKQTNHNSIPFINDIVMDLYHQQDQRSVVFGELVEDLKKDKTRCTHTRLKRILQISKDSDLKSQLSKLLDYYFDEVIGIEEIESEQTFDFAMNKTNTFIADGCINHNTTIALHAIAEANKNNKVAALIDAEHAFDPVYAENLGVHVSDSNLFLISQPNNGDEAIEVARELVNTGEVSVIVIDSVAALVPKAELQGDVGDSKMGLQARLMSQSMRMLTGDISRTGTIIIFINQLRDKIGIMFGNPETTTGGNALKFYASIRLDVRRININKDGDEAKSNRTKVKVVKNKTFPPFKQCEFDIVYGVGIDSCGEVLDLAVECEIIKKSGSWYSYQETRLGQGKDSVVSTLRDNPELVDELKEQVLKHLK